MTRARYLLDTHTFLWLKLDPGKVSTTVLTIASDLDCEVMMSVVTCWELAIKYRLGKLRMPSHLAFDLERAAIESGFSRMSISFVHAQRVMSLPRFPHKDPFDRMLIAQSVVEEAPLLSADPKFDQYGITRIW